MNVLEIIGVIIAAIVVCAMFILIHEFVHAFTCNECPYKDHCEQHKNDPDFICPCDEQNMMHNSDYGNSFQI